MKQRVLPVLLAAACGLFAQNNADLKEQVRAAERAFAKTMADRDHQAFTSFLANETVFFGNNVQRGPKQVADTWKRFFDGRSRSPGVHLLPRKRDGVLRQ